MKDEIKEILDRLKKIDHKEYIAFEFADSATFDEMARCFEERKKMADYITNLQEENEHLNDLLGNALKSYEEQREKIDKAIVLIKNDDIIVKIQEFENKYTVNFYDKKEDLLNILTGGDEEWKK